MLVWAWFCIVTYFDDVICSSRYLVPIATFWKPNKVNAFLLIFISFVHYLFSIIHHHHSKYKKISSNMIILTDIFYLFQWQCLWPNSENVLCWTVSGVSAVNSKMERKAAKSPSDGQDGLVGRSSGDQSPDLSPDPSLDELKFRCDSAATMREIASNPATHGSAMRQVVSGKVFKKCKSATFQIDGATYTIGKWKMKARRFDFWRFLRSA